MVSRAAALGTLLPGADVPKMCGKRPDLLLTSDAGAANSKVGHAAGVQAYQPVPLSGDAESQRVSAECGNENPEDEVRDGSGETWLERWHVAQSVAEMRRRMPPECDTCRLLTDFPNILDMDVPALFEDLRRVFPDKDPGDVLRRNPGIAYQFERNTANAEPLGPPANIMQAHEPNSGLLSIGELRELALAVKRNKKENNAPDGGRV